MPSTPDKAHTISATVAEIAKWVNGRVEGDAHLLISGFSSLQTGGPSDLSFLSNRRYRNDFLETEAGAVLVGNDEQVPPTQTVIRCADAYVAFATVLQRFFPQNKKQALIHPMAVVSERAFVGEGVHIEPFVFVAENAQIGPDCILESGVRIGAAATLGARCHIKANAVVGDGCILDDEVVLQPGAIVGADGFGFAPDSERLHKIPQVGRVRLGRGVELGANSCVDRPAFGETRLDEGVKTDNFVQVGHSAHIGAHSLMVAYSGVAGSTRIGAHSVLAAKAAVLGHLTLGTGVQVGAGSVVHRDQPDGQRVTGYPAISHQDWLRQSAILKRLPELKKGLAAFQSPSEDAVSYLPHRYPFVFLDQIVTLESPQHGHAIKCISRSEPFFQGHFPKNPIFPGVLQIEAMAQLAGSVALGRPLEDGELVMLAGVDRVRFHMSVRPGDKIDIVCTLQRQLKDMYIFDAHIQCNGQAVSNARITIAHQGIEPPASV